MCCICSSTYDCVFGNFYVHACGENFTYLIVDFFLAINNCFLYSYSRNIFSRSRTTNTLFIHRLLSIRTNFPSNNVVKVNYEFGNTVKEIPVLKVVGVNPLVKLEDINKNGLPTYYLCK